jgi:hypothetical protein
MKKIEMAVAIIMVIGTAMGLGAPDGAMGDMGLGAPDGDLGNFDMNPTGNAGPGVDSEEGLDEAPTHNLVMTATNNSVTITSLGNTFDVSGLIIANGNMAVYQFPAGTKTPIEVEVVSEFGSELRLTNGVGNYATAVVA